MALDRQCGRLVLVPRRSRRLRALEESGSSGVERIGILRGLLAMIDIGDKTPTDREAVAVGRVRMSQEAIQTLAAGTLPKGDALSTARVAGVMAAKRTADIIPLCHQIPLSYVDVAFAVDTEGGEVEIAATVRAHAGTGAEMEALTAVAVAALTIHDMCKGIDPATEIRGVRLVRKSGGKAGLWERQGDC